MPTYILHTHTYTYCTVCVYIWSLAHHHIGPHLGTWTAKHCAIPVQLASRWGPWGTVSKIKHDQSIQQLGCFQKNEYPTVHLKRSWSSQKGWTENSTTSFGGLHGPPNSVWWDTSSHQLPTSFPPASPFVSTAIASPGFSHLATFQEKWLPEGINPQKQNELWHVLISPFKKLKGNQEIHRNLCLSENKLPMATPHVASWEIRSSTRIKAAEIFSWCWWVLEAQTMDCWPRFWPKWIAICCNIRAISIILGDVKNN